MPVFNFLGYITIKRTKRYEWLLLKVTFWTNLQTYPKRKFIEIDRTSDQNNFSEWIIYIKYTYYDHASFHPFLRFIFTDFSWLEKRHNFWENEEITFTQLNHIAERWEQPFWIQCIVGNYTRTKYITKSQVHLTPLWEIECFFLFLTLI